MSINSYSGKLRIRVCGLLVKDEKLLLVRLKSPVTGQQVWLPPGGGVDFGERLEGALIREFREETGLLVEVGNLLHINEIIESGFHAVELYFRVSGQKGEVKLGTDPEHTAADQILEEIGFFSKSEMSEINAVPEFIRTKFWEMDDDAGIPPTVSINAKG